LSLEYYASSNFTFILVVLNCKLLCMFLLINLCVQNLVINVRSLLGLWFLDDMFIMADHGVKILGFWYFLMGNS
jgi:hypothetical protein